MIIGYNGVVFLDNKIENSALLVVLNFFYWMFLTLYLYLRNHYISNE